MVDVSAVVLSEIVMVYPFLQSHNLTGYGTNELDSNSATLQGQPEAVRATGLLHLKLSTRGVPNPGSFKSSLSIRERVRVRASPAHAGTSDAPEICTV